MTCTKNADRYRRIRAEEICPEKTQYGSFHIWKNRTAPRTSARILVPDGPDIITHAFSIYEKFYTLILPILYRSKERYRKDVTWQNRTYTVVK